MPQIESLDTAELPVKRERAAPQRHANVIRPSDQNIDYAVCPFTVAIDTREQAAWTFHGIATDGTRAKPAAPMIVPTEVKTLQTADYSIVGCEDRVVIERKSLSDLYGTLGGGRVRFTNELERMAAIAAHPAGGAAWVIVEANWQSILYGPPQEMKMTPKSVYRSVLAWQQREPFRRIHWLMMDTRELAERFAFRCLQRWWEDEQERNKKQQQQQQPI